MRIVTLPQALNYIQSLEGQLAAAKSFHDVAVAERNAARAEVEQLTRELELHQSKGTKEAKPKAEKKITD